MTSGEVARHDGARDQRIGAKAVLGDLVDEGVGRPQRLHAEPGRRWAKPTAWVTSYRRSSPACVQMSPLRALTTKFRRLAPSTSSRYVEGRMYFRDRSASASRSRRPCAAAGRSSPSAPGNSTSATGRGPEAEAHRLEQAQVARSGRCRPAEREGIEHGRALAVGVGRRRGAERTGRSPPGLRLEVARDEAADEVAILVGRAEAAVAAPRTGCS